MDFAQGVLWLVGMIGALFMTIDWAFGDDDD